MTLRTDGFAARYLTLFGGELLSKLCVLVAFAYLARVLAPADYGTVEAALSITVFFVLGVESGMGAYGARVVAATPDELPRLLPRIMVLRGLLGVPAVIVIYAFAMYSPSAVSGFLAITGLAVVVTPFLTQWVFQGLRQMRWVAAGGVLRNVVFVTLVLLLVRPGVSVTRVAIAELSSVCAMALLNSFHLYRRLGVRPHWRGALAGARRLFGEVWPLGLSDFAAACLWYSPVILAGWVSPDRAEQVAWIAAPMRITTSIHTIVWLYFVNLLPDLAGTLARSVDTWRDLMRRSLAAALWPAGLIAVGGTLVAPILVPAIFGATYIAAVRPFQIVIWMIPVAWFSGHFRFSLIAGGHQLREFIALACGAAVTVVAAIVLSRDFGSTGAAIAFLSGGIVNAILAMWFSLRYIGAHPDLRSLAPWSGAMALGIVVGTAVLMAIGPVAGASAGCATYLAFGLRHLGEAAALVKFARRS